VAVEKFRQMATPGIGESLVPGSAVESYPCIMELIRLSPTGHQHAKDGWVCCLRRDASTGKGESGQGACADHRRHGTDGRWREAARTGRVSDCESSVAAATWEED
jgi:hypothetical protein